MSLENRGFRRPAMLEPEVAEQIPGDEDPAITSSAALTAARALLGHSDDEFTAEQVDQLAKVIENEGVDTVSALWARSSALSLPGQMWRLYLLYMWCQRAPKVVQARYDEGIKALEEKASERHLTLPDLGKIQEEIGKLMGGKGTADLSGLLRQAGLLMHVLAAGASYGPEWIETDRSELADIVTRRAGALLKTGDEFLAASKLAQQEGYI
ncbi:hypothetical protein KRX54_02595 [Actinomycetaceae bacterium TAE3-ERU4]|nr:hypothetical protein [Actinomycetaceae bacterium TAE3-ERU4]